MITYPLNKIEYNATDAELFHCTRNSGIYAGDDFACTVTGADNNVTIGAGIGWIRNSKFSGKVIANKSDVVLDLGLADASLDRWDVVAIQFDKNNNATDLVVKHGATASTPTRPEIVQTETLYELYIAAFYRKAGATTITVSDIYDLRLDPTVCGLMADSVTEIDTTGINIQINALIEKLREEIAGVESSAEIMLKSVYDTDGDGVVDKAKNAENAENGVQTYTQSAGTLTGSGTNGKFKATASGTYTAFTISDVSYAVKAGSETEIELTSGVWYSFILDTGAKTINFKAGGAGLNFKIVGGTTQPTSPKENTIWIETDTEIGEWQFSSKQPTARFDGTALQNGDVWIETASTSDVTCNIVKNKGVVLNLSQAYQYQNGSWNSKNGKLYVNGDWKEFYGFTIVVDTSISAPVNSWAATQQSPSAWGGCSSSGGVSIGVDNSYGRVTEQVERDFSKYSRMEIYVSSRSNSNSCQFGIISNKNAGVSAGGHGLAKWINVGGVGAYSLDLSSYTDKGYLAIYLAYGGSVGINKIILYV